MAANCKAKSNSDTDSQQAATLVIGHSSPSHVRVNCQSNGIHSTQADVAPWQHVAAHAPPVLAPALPVLAPPALALAGALVEVFALALSGAIAKALGTPALASPVHVLASLALVLASPVLVLAPLALASLALAFAAVRCTASHCPCHPQQASHLSSSLWPLQWLCSGRTPTAQPAKSRTRGLSMEIRNSSTNEQTLVRGNHAHHRIRTEAGFMV